MTEITNSGQLNCIIVFYMLISIPTDLYEFDRHYD